MRLFGYSHLRRQPFMVVFALLIAVSGSGVSASENTEASDPIANRSELVFFEQRYWVETPEHPHNLRVFRSSSGRPTMRFELRPGEQREGERGERERVELRSRYDAPLGATRWYSGAFRLGHFVPDGDFNIISQWITDISAQVTPRGAGPWLRFELKRGSVGKLEISHRGSDRAGQMRSLETTIVDVDPGKWHNFVVQARTGLRNGFVRVWIDGKEVVNWDEGLLGDHFEGGGKSPTMGVMKFGLYRWGTRTDKEPIKSTATVWFTNIEEGNDLSHRVDRPLPLPSVRPIMLDAE